MKTNKRTTIVSTPVVTHEGGQAVRVSKKLELRRSVLSCLLWEDTFYEDGVSIADRISSLVKENRPEVVSALAYEARTKFKLRHVPLWLVNAMVKLQGEYRPFVRKALFDIVQRADELSEFIALYWKDGKKMLPNQVKLGLADAFHKFDEFQLARYRNSGDIKLRDVLRLVHPTPLNELESDLWKRLIKDELKTPDTWEVELSQSTDKNASWTRLLTENKVGPLALLRNLRNMKEANVDDNLIINALSKMKVERVLPFRFISAAKYAPHLEPYLEEAMLKCLDNEEKLSGKTVLLVDVSGSMNAVISNKSDLSRIDAACGLAILARELCEKVAVYTFSDNLVLVPSRRGFALRDAINGSQQHSNTYLAKAMEELNSRETYDRIIVFTDEQSHDGIMAPLIGSKSYLINVATNKYGVGYGKWTHIDGFSEAVFDYLVEAERVMEVDEPVVIKRVKVSKANKNKVVYST